MLGQETYFLMGVGVGGLHSCFRRKQCQWCIVGFVLWSSMCAKFRSEVKCAPEIGCQPLNCQRAHSPLIFRGNSRLTLSLGYHILTALFYARQNHRLARGQNDQLAPGLADPSCFLNRLQSFPYRLNLALDMFPIPIFQFFPPRNSKNWQHAEYVLFPGHLFRQPVRIRESDHIYVSHSILRFLHAWTSFIKLREMWCGW